MKAPPVQDLFNFFLYAGAERVLLHIHFWGRRLLLSELWASLPSLAGFCFYALKTIENAHDPPAATQVSLQGRLSNDDCSLDATFVILDKLSLKAAIRLFE